MDKVNVLYCFDSTCWRMAVVSIESLLSSANATTQITVYCMVTPGTRGYGKIKRIIKSHKSGDRLIWHVVKPEENPFYTPEYSRWSPAVFYRCFPQRLFKDVDKILYLNTVTLVFHDLVELFNTDISDYAFAAVVDMAPINDPHSVLGKGVRDFSAKYLNGGPYYNSGVLLLNLKKMAEYEHLLFETKIPLFYPNQDLLNAAFVGKIKTLPLKYNLAPGIGVPSHFSPEEAKEINTGKHVIIDCYYAKPYDKQSTNKLVYDMFDKCCRKVGMSPEKFLKIEQNKNAKPTFVPHVKVSGKAILFFGMKIN